MLHIISIVVLVIAFVLTMTRPLNLGALAFAGTFVVGALIVGLPTADILSGFPVSLVVTLIGVTYLFNVASANGTVEYMIAVAVRAVRGKVVLIPTVMFLVTAFVSGIGAVVAVPIVAPVALAFAAKHRISQTYMGLMVIHGCMAGSLSPISVYGVLVDGILEQNGLPSEPLLIFALGFVANAIAAVGVTAVLGRRSMLEKPSFTETDEPGVDGSGTRAHGDVITATAAIRADPEIRCTLLAITVMVSGAIALSLDVGLLGITLAVVLGLRWPERQEVAIKAIPWSVVLLVSGVLTYVGLLGTIGTVDSIGESVGALDNVALATLLLCFIGAIVSAFATSSGVIAALVPLSLPLLAGSSLGPIGLIGSIVVASTIVDVSPFSANGAVVVANSTSEVRSRVLRRLLVHGGIVVVVAPVALWGLVILPGWA
ncbi:MULTISPECIES: SLC13 family permease [unclassified Rhodococcus (in: high G+C Gram-positive bacteria)]|uniref:SLC13 family permease n=1 Tax=unclassified Rhodococcus (in: high G+C Gram-positive bacteria) TaxID=192944 RepID=UPI000B9B3DCE|nr:MULTISPECIES: SLC13 family permease [unclassified Rhodococcus (in: high G+C Gram-positive bacteria)]OZE37616.1 hypothetical protein CH259_12290 [Rhodococcus sp. 05-2254-4]OZE40748.1 hypothetical protein CH261_27255 [Rhodococcus sp. 05-2254-3]OZE45739.1 hypothetical protein CH283_25910 [Rhodococcus sp. 05-2254-2]